ncbi:MAG: hypothetical protein HY927_10355 [Elusimicrobia bacterium]|nr:hypothetical protein [Elusimicrobiota bacterium]
MGPHLYLFSFLLVLNGAYADDSSPAKKKPFGAKYIGENGAYKHPTGAASDALETASRQEGGQGTFGPITADGKPAPQGAQGEEAASDAVQAPSPSHSAPAVSMVPAAGGTATPSTLGSAASGQPEAEQVDPSAQKESKAGDDVLSPEERKRYALWDGLVAPTQKSSAKADERAPDPAPDAGRPGHLPAGKAGGERPFVVPPYASAGGGNRGRELLVRFDLAVPKTADAAQGADAPAQASQGDLRDAVKDAVAELQRVADFRVDPNPESLRDSVAGRVSIRGWMPPDKIASAMRVTAVSRLEIEPHGSRPVVTAQATTEILVGIRVPKVPGADALRSPGAAGRPGSPEVPGADALRSPGAGALKEGAQEPGGASATDAAADGALADILRRLGAETGFSLGRTIGFQESPGGKETVIVVSGTIPVRNISKAMADFSIVKILPMPETPQAEKAVSRRKGFLSFVLSRSPLLVMLTVLLLLSPMSLGLLKHLNVFNPYKKT